MLDDAREHGGNQERLRHALGGGKLEPRGRVELGQDHHAPRRIGRAQECRDPGDVIRRHRDQRGLLVARAAELDRRKHIGAEMCVAEHGGLWRTGRAAREELNGDRVRVLIAGAEPAPRPAGASRSSVSLWVSCASAGKRRPSSCEGAATMSGSSSRRSSDSISPRLRR